MEGFLDDDEAGDGMKGGKRRHMMGDVQPISTGLCWDGTSGSHESSTVPYGQTSLDLTSFRMDVLLGTCLFTICNRKFANTNLVHPHLPIDPYSTAYWPSPASAQNSTLVSSKSTATMAPPHRIPLHTVNASNTLLPIPQSLIDPSTKPSPITGSSTSTSKARKTPTKPLPPELLDDFKLAVQGSDLTKAGLVEVLKKQYVYVHLAYLHSLQVLRG